MLSNFFLCRNVEKSAVVRVLDVSTYFRELFEMRAMSIISRRSA